MSSISVVKEEEQIPKEKKSSSQPRRKLFLVLIFLYANLIFFGSPFFYIKKIVIKGNLSIPYEDVMSKIDVRKGNNVWLVLFSKRLPEARKKIQQNPLVKKVAVKCYFPHQIAILITERKPSFFVKSKEVFFAVDDEGRILYRLDKVDNTFLPIVLGFAPSVLVPGKDLPYTRNIMATVENLDLINKNLNEKINSFYVDHLGEITFYTKDQIKIKLGQPKNLNDKLAVLIPVLAKVRKYKIQHYYIDVRTEKAPVVKLKNEE
jgi:cell division septal protein FtsQ